MSYVISTEDNTREFDDKAEFEETRDLLEEQGVDFEVTETPADTSEEDSRRDFTGGAEIVENATETDVTPAESDLPDEPRVDQDPVEWLPEHFIDHIKGVPTVNRKGYAVIASKYGVSVTSEPVTLASETDFEYAEFKAVAVTKDGSEYSGFGSAHVDRQDGDDPYLLNELAETRAMKRAVSWASGVGLTAAQEMMGDME